MRTLVLPASSLRSWRALGWRRVRRSTPLAESATVSTQDSTNAVIGLLLAPPRAGSAATAGGPALSCIVRPGRAIKDEALIGLSKHGPAEGIIVPDPAESREPSARQ